MVVILRSPDGRLVEVESAVLRVQLKAQGYREVAPEPDVEPEPEPEPEIEIDHDDLTEREAE